MHELNLLPPQRRRSLQTEYVMMNLGAFLSRVVIGLLVLTGIGAATAAGLWTLSVSAARSTETELGNQVDQYKGLRQEVLEQNIVLQNLASLGEQRIVWSDFLREMLAVVPPSVTIAQMDLAASLAEGKLTVATVTFKGQAVTRSALIIFLERLNTLPTVTRVISPTSNLLERSNPTYEFTLELKVD